MKSDVLLAAIKRAITVPDYQNRFSEDDIFAFINEEQQSTVVPILLSVREEYTVVHDDISIDSNDEYLQIPVRAIGRNLREIHAQGNPNTNYTFSNVARIAIEEVWRFQQQTGSIAGFVVEGDYIRLLPSPGNPQIVRLYYNQKPSDIVSINRCANIISVNGNAVTVDMVPSNIVTNSVCDITQYRPGYVITQKDATVTSIVGNVLTFGGLTAVKAVPGDSVSLALETCIVQMPDEATQVLVQATALRIIEAYGDPNQIQQVKMQLDQKIINAQKLFAPRVQGELQKVTNRDGVIRQGIVRRIPYVTV